MEQDVDVDVAETQRIESAEELEESVDINETFAASVAVGEHAFARMEADHDQLRKEKLSSGGGSRARQADWQQNQARERAKR